MILAIDPGPELSAWVMLNENGQPIRWAKSSNQTLRSMLANERFRVVAIEMIASYGMAVGREVFETCVHIGRFIELANRSYHLVYRREVKTHLCENQKANDSNIRMALIDRFGPGKEKAIGVKASPGPLYGMKADCWQALALGVTFYDKHETVATYAVEVPEK